MSENTMIDKASTVTAETISRFKKERFLLSMSEDKFRDEVVRPLLLRLGLKDGRDVCGPFEKGKDAVFVALDQLGMRDVYVVQTKRGPLNLARKASANVVEAATQLKTALDTKVSFISTKEKKLPSKVILCASGKINEAARQHIVDEVRDPRIIFMDSDDLIPKIDEKFPELWFGIDAEILPYLRFIRRSIEESSENLSISDVLPGGGSLGAATDKMFVSLQLWRPVSKLKRRKGQVVQVPEFQEMPITGILNRRDRLVLILGEAGAGKSTSVRRLAYVLAEKGFQADKDYKVPILLRAFDVSKRSGSPLVEICAEETKRLTGSSKPSFSVDDLLNGRVVVFIDALDEVAEDVGRRPVLQLIDDFHKLYPKCQIIITSRNYAFLRDLPELKNFETYRLSPINYRQAAQIIDRLQKGRSLPAENSKEILRRLQEVHGMELNPLLVTVFAATSDYSRRDIPANITELFKKFTEMMLGRWDATKGFAQQYHAPLKDFILTKVAFEIHRRQTADIDIEEFKSMVERELVSRGHKVDLDQLLDEILNRSGLFRIMGSTVEFRHLLLQEFFAGRGIPSRDFLEALVPDEWWRRAIVFYFGQNPGESGGLESIMRLLNSKPVDETYNAAVTLGLALQACYLVHLKEKVDILRKVIEGLAIAKHGFLQIVDKEGRFPLTRFLGYYLHGRDSVALSILEQNVDEISKPWSESSLSQDEKDIRTFWIVVGLIESGSLDKAEKIVRQFCPSDARLLLAIHLGCFLIQQLRIFSKEQRQSAERISQNLSERVSDLRIYLLNEVKSELLEVRRGEIKAIDSPKD